MAQTTIGAVTIHRLRSGVTVQLYMSVNKGLYQVFDTNYNCTPDWSIPGNSPTITPIMTGGTMLNPKWYVNLPENVASADLENYSIANVLTNKYTLVESTGQLTLTGNLLDKETIVAGASVANIVLTFVCTASAGGANSEIKRSIVIAMRSGGENSYWGHINASNGTTLGQYVNAQGNVGDINSTVLNPSLNLGTSEVDPENYVVKWYKTGAASDGGDLEITNAFDAEINGLKLGAGNSLIVYRNGVDGMSHFECHFFVNEVKVEAEGIQISDNADEYFVAISGEASVYTSSNANVVLTASLFRRLTNQQVTSGITWQCICTDSERMNEYNSDSYILTTNDSGSATLTMSEANMYVPNTDAVWKAAHPDETYPWLLCGASSNDDTSQENQITATPCDVIVQFVATL